MSTPNPQSRTRRSSPWSAILIAFALVTCVKVWLPREPIVTPVQAQVPNPADDRKEEILLLRRTNELLTDIKRILESQTLHVVIERADNSSSAKGVAPSDDR